MNWGDMENAENKNSKGLPMFLYLIYYIIHKKDEKRRVASFLQQ